MRKLFIFLVAAAVTMGLFTNFCDLMFACGCVSAWAGAAAHCNIHQPGVKHCPWCSHGRAGGTLSLGGILLPQAAISFWPGRASWRRLPLALIAFPVAGAMVAATFGFYSGYWAS
jgi:hypothetical protein